MSDNTQNTGENEGQFEQWPADFFKPPSVPLGGHIPGITDVPTATRVVEETPIDTSSTARIIEDKPKRIALVIDANVIIKQLSLRDILGGGLTEDEFSERYEVHTIRDVIKEIKDQNARTYLENHLPYPLIIHDSLQSTDLLDRVHAFAKETGDFKTLSATDMKVIALGLELTDAAGELERVEAHPRELQEFRPKRFAEEYKRLEEGEDQDDSEEETDSD
jgi:rRNA maturation endonuclease Nob1